MESPLFYILLFLHLVSLITGFGAVITIDTFGLLWLRGRMPMAQVMKTAAVTQRLIWLGWSGMVISGIPMLYMKGYVDNLTKLKLFFVAMVGFNGLLLHFIKRATDRLGEGEEISPRLKFRIGLSSTISQAGWWGALLIGFLHRQVSHDIPYPSNPYFYMGLVAGAFVGAGLVGLFLLPKTK